MTTAEARKSSGGPRSTPAKTSGGRWGRFLRVAMALLILLTAVGIGFYRPVLDAAGSALCLQDHLARADAIVVLAGERGERVRQGVALYRHKWAPILLMSGGPGEAGIPLAHLMRDQAAHAGVPASAILVEDRSLDTGEDARCSLAIARQRGWQRVILVTSPYHARRAARLFRRVFGSAGIEVLSYPVQQAWFSPDEWWTRKLDTRMVLMEYLKSTWYLFSW